MYKNNSRDSSKQIKPHGINYEYDFDEEDGTCTVSLSFENETEDCHAVYALQVVENDLIERHSNDEAFELFKRGDFRIYMT